MASPQLKYEASGDTVVEFMQSDAYVRGIRGPVGSGKSVACCIEILRRACMQAPNDKNVRRSRWAIVRNTNPMLKTTTIKTWRDWFNDDWGKFNWSPPFTHHVNITLADKTRVECEVIFLALDRPDDVKKLLSLELTGVWINEAREVSKDIVDACTMRIGRFPSMRDGGPSWYGMIMDTNSPDEIHWWGILAGEVPIPEFLTDEEKRLLVRPEGWEFYTQNPAMFEQLDDKGELTGYELNPEAENLSNLAQDYYWKTISGKNRPWVRAYVLNRYQSINAGKAVYPTFRRETHVSRQPLEAIAGRTIYCGMDFGRTPAAVFGQVLPSGRWNILHEVITSNMGVTRFSEILKREIADKGWDIEEMRFFGDPTGDYMGQTNDETPFQILRANGLPTYPAPTNDPALRIETVETLLNRMVDGHPGFVVSATCLNLIAGFEGGYQYRRLSVTASEKYEDKPDKNRFSHPHDALQYLVGGAGESRNVMTGRRTGTAKATVVKRNWSVFAAGRKARAAFRK